MKKIKLFTTLIFLFFLLYPYRVVFAENNIIYWSEPFGPYSESIGRIFINPIKRNILYVGAGGKGIYKSYDYGKTWLSANNGLDKDFEGAGPLAIHPRNPDIIFAGATFREKDDQTYKSTNGGINWFKIADEIYSPFVFSPSDPNIIYESFKKSTNGGINWFEMRRGFPYPDFGPAIDMDIDPKNPNIAYQVEAFSGESPSNGIFKTQDGGKTWRRVFGGDPIEKTHIDNLIVDPDNSKVIYASSWEGILKSEDYGEHWTYFQDWSADSLVSPRYHSEIFYAIKTDSSGHSYLAKSADKGKSWEELPIDIPHVVNIEVDPLDISLIYASTWTGLYKSTNGGKNWEKSDSGISNTGFYSIAFDPNSANVIYALTEAGLLKSTNKGYDWLFLNKNEYTYSSKNRLSFAPKGKNEIYLLWGGKVNKSTNGGVSFEQDNSWPTEKKISSITTDPVSENIRYICGEPHSGSDEGKFYEGIYKTTNKGITWTLLTSDIKPRNISVDYQNSNIVYNIWEGKIYKSTNGGFNWIKINVSFTYDYFVAPPKIWIDPINSNNLYTIAREGLSKSTNQGLYWQKMENKGFTGEVWDLAFDPTDSNILYGATGLGVVRGNTHSVERTIERFYGEDRYKTASELSRMAYPNGANYVILARGDLFPDALCGAPLAVKYNAPLLLSPPEGLCKATEDEIKRLKAKEVFVLGTNDALSDQVLSDLQNKCGIDNKYIHRIGGLTRYETSAEIAKLLDIPQNKSAFIATGENYPDALAAAPISATYKMPIFLVRGDISVIPQAIKDALKEKKINRTIIVGGSDVVPDEIAQWLDTNGYPARRIQGDTRYETAVELVRYTLNPAENYPNLSMNPHNLFIAWGENFPDALATGPIAARTKSPLIMTQDLYLPLSVYGFLSQNRDRIYWAHLVGGADVVSQEVSDEILALISGE